MKTLLCLLALLCSLPQARAQVYAIVTVELTQLSNNNLREFVLLLDDEHAPRSVAAFMLLGEPNESSYRNRLRTFTLNPSGQYIPSTEAGAPTTPSFTAYTISTNAPGNSPSVAFLSRPGGSVLATFTRTGDDWNSDNPAITLRYNSNQSVQSFMIDIKAELPHFDATDNYFRNSSSSLNNPGGSYSPSQAGGAALDGDPVFTMTPIFTPTFQITGATLSRNSNEQVVATFTREGVQWVSDNAGYSLNYSSSANRYVLRENVALAPTLTTEPFYGDDDMIFVGGDHPYLSLGRDKAVPNQSNGLIFQNEIVDVNAASFSNDSLWGLRFADLNGNVGNSQRYAVAFANIGTQSPNTAGGEVLITGFAGNPDFDGRHTHIGYVVNGTYFKQSGGTVPGSRPLIDLIMGGEPAEFRGIRFENASNTFDAFEFTNPGLAEIRLPRPEMLTERSVPCAESIDDEVHIFSGGTPGELRFLERSDDFSSWSFFATAGEPVGADARYGLNIERPSILNTGTGERSRIRDAHPDSFFRTTPMVVDHPQWPASLFRDELPNASLSFKGRVVDGDNPQVLNVFNIFLDATGKAGQLQGVGGDLAGNHVLSSVRYYQTGPMTGELELEGDTLPELLRLRLYFDSHKGGELTGGRNPIERFHRLAINEVEIAGNSFFLQQVSEFGIWISNN
jgi:cyclophilin family peptidyl-prolyl cis-trans isomerase